MSDFRVILINADQDVDQELDWDNKKRVWTLSEKEIGLGSKWMQGLSPNNKQLKSLLKFFRIREKDVNGLSLLQLSPGDLVKIHKQSTKKVLLHAKKCNKCREHWGVFRWEGVKKGWRTFGRTCDFSWKRGIPLSKKETNLLLKIKGII